MNEDSTSEVLYIIFALSTFCLFMSLIVTMLSSARKMDNTVYAEGQSRKSVYYSMAYSESDLTVAPANVYTDILNENSNVDIFIGTNHLNNDFLVKLRSNNTEICRDLWNLLNHEKYRKINMYDTQGNVSAIRYEEVE